MAKNYIKRYLPNPRTLREHKMLQPVAHFLHLDEIWHLNRRAAAGAVFIGLFTAFIPIPAQMLVAAALAIYSRCNLPIAVALVWITNPITMPPMFYFSYRLGAWLLNMELEAGQAEMSLAWIWDHMGTIGYPFLFGSFVCGWVAGITGFVVTRVVWRWHVIKRWQERRHRRRELQN